MNQNNALKPFTSFAVVLLIFTLFAYFFFLNVIMGKSTFIGWVDNVQQYYFWSQFSARELHQGRFPLIASNAGAGMFFPGELQHAPFYPVTLAWNLIFGSIRGISQFHLDLIVIFHSILGGMAMMFLSRSLSVSFLGSFLSGLFFAFSGNFLGRADDQANILFCLAYVPFVMGCWIQFLKTKRYHWCWAGGIGLGLSLLAGHFVGVVFAFLGCFLFTGMRIGEIFRKKVIPPVLFGVAIFGVTSFFTSFVQLVPSFLYQKDSLRWVGLPEPVSFGQKLPYDLIGEKYRIHLYHLFQFLDPRLAPEADGNLLYFGLVPLLLICFYFYFKKHIGIGKMAESSTVSTFAVLIFLAGLLLSLGRLTPVHYVLTRLPFFDTVRASSRYLFLSQIGALLLFGAAVDFFAGHRAAIHQYITNSKKLIFSFVFLFVLLVWARFTPYTVETNFFKCIEMVMVFLVCGFLYCFVKNQTVSKIALIAMVVINIFAYGDFYVRSNTIDFDWPIAEELHRIVNDSRIAIGHDVSYENLPANISLSGKLNILTTYGATMPAGLYHFLAEDWRPEGLSYDRLAVQYFISATPISGLPLVFCDLSKNIFLHKRPNALPEVYSPDAGVGYRIVKSEQNDRLYRIDLDKAGNVIFALLYHPGWKVEVDGAPSTLYPTGGYNRTEALIGLHLEPGAHTVKLNFPFTGIFYK
ncbi:MAG: hypothetical protein V2B19_22500 [Pseudomonadota bacterium]